MGLDKNIGWKNYVGNNLFAMGLLNIGLGYQGSLDICGFLGMKKPWSTNTYRVIEEDLSVHLKIIWSKYWNKI